MKIACAALVEKHSKCCQSAYFGSSAGIPDWKPRQYLYDLPQARYHLVQPLGWNHGEERVEAEQGNLSEGEGPGSTPPPPIPLRPLPPRVQDVPFRST